MSTQRTNLPKVRRKKLGGFALVFVLAFAAIVAVFTATAGAQAAYNLHLASGRGQTDRAYYAANTGTQMILGLLREPPVDYDYDGDGVEGTWLGEDGSLYFSMEKSQSEAFAHVYHNIKGYDHAVTEAPDGTKIPPECFYIISLGNLDGNPSDGMATPGGVQYNQATMGSTLTPSFPILPQAAFAFETLTITDAVVDHFNSASGPGPWMASGNASAPISSKKLPEASVATGMIRPHSGSSSRIGRIPG